MAVASLVASATQQALAFHELVIDVSTLCISASYISASCALVVMDALKPLSSASKCSTNSPRSV